MPGLEDLYREIILDHYRNPRNRGELEPPAHRTEGFNPLCGDEIVVYVSIDDEQRLADIKIGGQGCSISQSSASMMSSAVKGRTLDEARTAIGAAKRQRFSRAVRSWVARHPFAADLTLRADAVVLE